MDVESVLLNVQERDKWRRRLELLRASLGELKLRRARVTQRLRRIKRELRRLGEYSDAVLHQNAHQRGASTFHAAADTHLSAR
ncbi:MAG: hypothetical protein L3J91_06175 [Thermoplasmata archaeon]|nr:hypothetical protein [Thermoplasmata archaeon]